MLSPLLCQPQNLQRQKSGTYSTYFFMFEILNFLMENTMYGETTGFLLDSIQISELIKNIKKIAPIGHDQVCLHT